MSTKFVDAQGIMLLLFKNQQNVSFSVASLKERCHLLIMYIKTIFHLSYDAIYLLHLFITVVHVNSQFQLIF